MHREVAVSVLLDALADKRIVGTPPSSVRGLCADSRRVERGEAFVAVPGLKQDARRFVPDAVARGATLVVTEGDPVPDVRVAQVLVPSARRALASLAGAYWGHPSRALTLVGITGTNGKTTTSYPPTAARWPVPCSTTSTSMRESVRAVSGDTTWRTARGSMRRISRPSASNSAFTRRGCISVPPLATAPKAASIWSAVTETS